MVSESGLLGRVIFHIWGRFLVSGDVGAIVAKHLSACATLDRIAGKDRLPFL